MDEKGSELGYSEVGC